VREREPHGSVAGLRRSSKWRPATALIVRPAHARPVRDRQMHATPALRPMLVRRAVRCQDLETCTAPGMAAKVREILELAAKKNLSVLDAMHRLCRRGEASRIWSATNRRLLDAPMSTPSFRRRRCRVLSR
jgi:hypothetical protein